MRAADLALLTDAAKSAGQIALKYWRNQPKTWDKPGTAGPVTEADLAVDADLRDTLTAARPAYGWLSEETPDDAARLTAETLFIVDPIDGTRAFVAGAATWALSLAVVRAGTPEAAVVYLPAKDLLYGATPDAATRNGRPIRCSDRAEVDGATLLAARPNLDPQNWRDATLPPVARHFRPSLAYRMALVAEGRFDAMLTLRRAWEWDIAAGALIAQAAGARVTDRSGAPLRFNNPDPMVAGVLAGAPAVHSGLLHRLRPRGRNSEMSTN